MDSKSLFTGSDGASQANLRGLGAQGTLVLMNGRRLSYYGAPAGFQTQFVNIDSIPAAAIERMEILTGSCRILRAGSTEWESIEAGGEFSVEGDSSFEIEVSETVDYICHYG